MTIQFGHPNDPAALLSPPSARVAPNATPGRFAPEDQVQDRRERSGRGAEQRFDQVSISTPGGSFDPNNNVITVFPEAQGVRAASPPPPPNLGTGTTQGAVSPSFASAVYQFNSDPGNVVPPGSQLNLVA